MYDNIRPVMFEALANFREMFEDVAASAWDFRTKQLAAGWDEEYADFMAMRFFDFAIEAVTDTTDRGGV